MPTSPTICAGWFATGWSPVTATTQVLAYITERYGDFVLLKPPVRPATWLLWFGPPAVLAAGGLLIVVYFRTRGAAAGNVPELDGARAGAAQAAPGRRRERLRPMGLLLPAFAVLTGVAVLAVLWPVFRRRPIVPRGRFELGDLP